MNQVQLSPPNSMNTIIERAALDPTFDLDKLQRLLDMQEASQIRFSDQAFTAAHASAEAEMGSVITDKRNDQTRSNYATFAQVDREARPIYTRHGFAISFTTEPTGLPEQLLVVGTLSHRDGGSRRYQVPVPIVTTGFKGQQMMTPIHATMSAISYGKRNLEVMMFNLQVDADSDGNAPRKAPTPRARADASTPPATEYTDPETGEVVVLSEGRAPGIIPWKAQDTWQSWGRRFIAHLRTSTNLNDVQQWVDLNTTNLHRMETEVPAMRVNLASSIDAFKETLA
jgi:hypothetical protein